ncbi:MAG: hypothetical protein OXJ90_16360 [Spirochaetaceae bacterium]|nr:hypothetical protein [Spirochaetaceae bacterium]
MAARGQRKKTAGRTRRGSRDGRGRLRIGNQWNAITIIALSQNSPLKAIAEFVENSIVGTHSSRSRPPPSGR